MMDFTVFVNFEKNLTPFMFVYSLNHEIEKGLSKKHKVKDFYFMFQSEENQKKTWKHKTQLPPKRN